MLVMDIARVHARLADDCQLLPHLPVLVGVSGGPDSLCLADLLDLLGYQVVVAHLDHGLRAASAQDAVFVSDFAAVHGMRFTGARVDVGAYAAQAHLSLEEAARKARYRFLFDQAARFQAQAVAVAHTADDQVETVLMHLLRGAGLSGLKGMLFRSAGREWGSALPLVRPLLDAWREEVLDYCRERGLEPRFDESNEDASFHRNRIRHQLLPNLQTYNPRIKAVLWRTAQTLSADHAALESVLTQAETACAMQKMPGYISFTHQAFTRLPVSQQRSLLRGAIAHLLPNLRDVDFNAVERGLQFVHTPTATRQVDLVKGLYLLVEGERLFLARRGELILDDDWPWLPAGQSLALPVPGQVVLPGGWLLRAELRPAPALDSPELQGGDGWQCWLDAETLPGPLVVRASQPGERFQPLGMHGHSLRLSDYWVNKKLSRRARSTWPLVWSGNHAAWIPGFQPGHLFRVTAQTRSGLHLVLCRSTAQAAPESDKT